jgi:hypothetical protein
MINAFVGFSFTLRKCMLQNAVMKIGTVGAELFRVDGHTVTQTDMTKLIVAFRNFANAPKTREVAMHKSLCTDV